MERRCLTAAPRYGRANETAAVRAGSPGGGSRAGPVPAAQRGAGLWGETPRTPGAERGGGAGSGRPGPGQNAAKTGRFLGRRLLSGLQRASVPAPVPARGTCPGGPAAAEAPVTVQLRQFGKNIPMVRLFPRRHGRWRSLHGGGAAFTVRYSPLFHENCHSKNTALLHAAFQWSINDRNYFSFN